MIVRELITRLGFDSTKAEQSAKRFDRLVGGLRRRLIQLAATAAGVFSGAALVRMTVGFARTANDVADLAETVGMTAEQIQGLHFAAQRLGIGIPVVNSAIRAFARRIGAAARDSGPAADMVEQLNLRLRDANNNLRPTADLFFEVSNIIASLGSEAEQIELADIFFSETGRPLSLLLREGEAGIRAYMLRQRQLGALVDEFTVKKAQRFIDAMDDFNAAMTGVRITIGSELMPHLTSLLERFIDWWMANQRLIRQNIGGFIRNLVFTVRLLWMMLKELGGAVDSVAQAFGGWERTIRLLIATLTALGIRGLIRFLLGNLPKLVSQLGLVRGVLAALGALFLWLVRRSGLFLLILLIEDLLSFMEGAPSTIGDFVEWLKKWRDAIQETLADIKKAIKDWFADSAVGRFLSTIFGGIGSLASGLNEGMINGGSPRVGPGGGSIVRQDITINERVEVNVPPGTPREQAMEIQRQVREQVRAQLDANLRAAANEEPAL